MTLTVTIEELLLFIIATATLASAIALWVLFLKVSTTVKKADKLLEYGERKQSEIDTLLKETTRAISHLEEASECAKGISQDVKQVTQPMSRVSVHTLNHLVALVNGARVGVSALRRNLDSQSTEQQRRNNR